MADVRIATMSDGREVAYRVMSDHDGPTMLHTQEGTAPIELLDEDPMYDQFLRTVGRCGQLVLFDKPGIGASDPFDRDRDYGQQVVEAYLAVLDALGLMGAWVVGAQASLAASLARQHRSRIHGVALVNPVSPTVPLNFTFDDILQRDGDFMTRIVAPSRADDSVYVAWSSRVGRLGASAADARAFWDATRKSRRADDQLEPISDGPPVLIIRRRDALDSAHAEWWHGVFPDAEIVTLEGNDLAVVSLDAATIAETIVEFISGERIESAPDRRLVAVLFTDLVESTKAAAAAGDTAWRSTLDRYETLVARTIERHHGTLVKPTGDGVLATFPSGSQALRAATELRSTTDELGLNGRTGIHVGEVERRGDDIGGIAVHLTARVMGEASPGEIVVSSALAQTTVGGAFRFRNLGARPLKGIDQTWQLFAVEPRSREHARSIDTPESR
jgi:class 3 adenylate cyclase